MEFFVVFLVSLFILMLLVVGLLFGRPPTYRPDREYVLKLMQGVEDRSTTEQAWSLFVHTPITHDADLEEFRRRCYKLDQGEVDNIASGPGLNGYLYDLKGRDYIKQLAAELQEFIRNAPLTVNF
ncbi:hypothetical protein SAMN03080615_03199 [Amphritea atlantica]|uniref:Uncharacterized protein n=1 Tax=Amphritea atlantica TaxID=355243 RepID=A0A1H9JUK8_9GAMM|nr:hypothetical protein [Amphritea atlantica]SEQ90508.1 hypothetical protein SAMN03080615_03199 [Amphritea atlantica]